MSFVGADWDKRATEGPIIQKLGGEWRLFASCGDDEPEQFQNRYPIYFLRPANPEMDEDPSRAEEGTAEVGLRRLPRGPAPDQHTAPADRADIHNGQRAPADEVHHDHLQR